MILGWCPPLFVANLVVNAELDSGIRWENLNIFEEVEMRYWIGTDEAGYGPTLGPLLISATLWTDTDQTMDDCPHNVHFAHVSAPMEPVSRERVTEKTMVKKQRKRRAMGYDHDLFDWKQPDESQKSVRPQALTSGAPSETTARLLTWSMERFVSALVTTLPRMAATRLVAADSKKLYTPQRGIAPLERHLFGFFELAGWPTTTTFRELLQRAASDDTLWQTVPWYRTFDMQLPQNVLANHGQIVAETRRKWANVGIAFRNFACRFLDADAFNRQLAQQESKADLLSTATLGLVIRHLRDILTTSDFPEELFDGSSESSFLSAVRTTSERRPLVTVLCDKHGGRNAYASILTRLFCEQTARDDPNANRAADSTFDSPHNSHTAPTVIERSRRLPPSSALSALWPVLHPFTPPRIVRESREESVYELESTQFRIRFYFTAKGEKRIPVALASMLSKYLREMAMTAFNAFWQQAWRTNAESPQLVSEWSPFVKPLESMEQTKPLAESAKSMESATKSGVKLDRVGLSSLRPTAGYPEDAVRFLAEIEPLRQKLGIPLAMLRRAK